MGTIAKPPQTRAKACFAVQQKYRITLERNLMKLTSRWIASLLAACLTFTGFAQSAMAAGLVSTEQVAATEGVKSATAQREYVNTTLARADVAATVANTLDTAPAGASDVLGVIVTIFIVLLITDILGFTKVYPFTRSIR
jgi:hypothetical protein